MTFSVWTLVVPITQCHVTHQRHRVERTIIDGIADAEHFARGEWLTNLQDTDLIATKSEKCALYTEGGGQTIRNKFEETVNSLYKNPIGVPATGSMAPDLITYSNIMWVIRQALCGPIQFFSNLASLLEDLSYRKGTSLAIAKQAEQRISTPSNECLHAPPYAPGAGSQVLKHQ